MTPEYGENPKFGGNAIINLAYINIPTCIPLRTTTTQLHDLWLKAVNFFRKTLHLRCLTEF